MTLDAGLNLIAASRPSNLMQSIMSGLQAGQTIRNIPLMQSLLEQKVVAGQQSQEAEAQRQQLLQNEAQRAGTQFAQQQEIQKAAFANRLAKQLKAVPMEQRGAVLQQNAGSLRTFGIEPEQLNPTDENLDRTIQGTEVLIGGQEGISPLDRAKLSIDQQEVDVKKENLALKRREFEARLNERPGSEIKFSDLRGVSSDISKILNESQKVKNAASRLAKISQTKSPTDQLAAVFTFMKALDPSSVVREGEQDQARATGGITDQFISYIDRIRGEGSLPEGVFDEMVMTAKRLANQSIDDAAVEIDAFIDPLSDNLPDPFIQKTRSRVPVKFKEQPDQPQNDPLGIR